MAKIQKETITITFSKLVKDSDAATDTILASHMAEQLQVHAQGMVDASIMVEATIQEDDEDFDWYTPLDTDHSFVEFEEEAPAEEVHVEEVLLHVEEAPVVQAPVEEDTMGQDYIDSGF
jgi:hypothetical protein